MSIDLQPWIKAIFESWISVLGAYIIGIVVLSAVVQFVVSRIEYRLIGYGRWPKELSLVGKFFAPTEFLLISLAVAIVPTVVATPAKVDLFLRGLGKVGVILSVMWILLRLTNALTSIYLRVLPIDQPDNLRQRRIRTQIQYLEKLLDIVIVFLAVTGVMLSFETFRRFGGSMLASAGLASLIIGFSAQKSLANLVAGLQIVFTQPIRWGDAVIVENEWGEIEEITLTYVVIRIWDLRRLVVPITYFLEKPFQNWTRNSADLVGHVVLHVDYKTPIEPLRQELLRLLQHSPWWDKKVGVLQVVDTNDRVMVLRCLMSAANSGAAWELRCHVREKMITFLCENSPDSLPKMRIDRESLSPLRPERGSWPTKSPDAWTEPPNVQSS